jgi:CubicO group peptidase (beta-lactamase class C family)
MILRCREELTELVRVAAEAKVAQFSTLAMAIALISGEDTQYQFFGQKHKCNETTIFEIGDITKTFTGTLVGHLQDEELVSLNESIVAKGLDNDPELGRFPASITWGNLADHTSGTPTLRFD